MGIPKGITEFKFTQALPIAAAASADRNGAVIDMMGYRGVFMQVTFGAIVTGAVTSIKAQQDTALAFNVDPQDLAGTRQAVADDDDDQLVIIDLYEPTDRYVRLVIDKDASNNTVETATYIQYGARNRPTTPTVTDKVTYERHESPAEGTA